MELSSLCQYKTIWSDFKHVANKLFGINSHGFSHAFRFWSHRSKLNFCLMHARHPHGKEYRKNLTPRRKVFFEESEHLQNDQKAKDREHLTNYLQNENGPNSRA